MAILAAEKINKKGDKTMAFVGNSDVTEDKFKELVQGGVEAANTTAITITQTFRGMVTTNTVAVPLAAVSSKLKVGGFIANLTGSPTVYLGPSTVTLAADDVTKSVLEAGAPLPLFAGEDLAELYVISASAGHITFRGV